MLSHRVCDSCTILQMKTWIDQDWFDENQDHLSSPQFKDKAYADWQNDPSSISKKV